MWLSHHQSTERCTKVGGSFVCRRCLVLYPGVVLTALVAAALGPASPSSVVPAVYLLLAPMVVDWVLEHAGRITYSPRRQSFVSLAAGVGGGLALSIHMKDPFNLSATVPIVTVAIICLVSALVNSVSSVSPASGPDDDDWLARHEAAEARRLEELQRLLDVQESHDSVTSREPSPR